MRRSEVKFLGVVESVTKVETGCLRTTKVAIFVAGNKIRFSRTKENMGYVYLKLRLDKPQYNAYNSIYNDNGPSIRLISNFFQFHTEHYGYTND